MKIYKFISTVILGMSLPLSFTSCVDLTQEPLSFYTMENYKPEPASFESMANGLYQNFAFGGLSGNNYGFNTRIISLSVGADDIIDGKKMNNRLTYIDRLALQNYTTDDIKTMWEFLYTTVQSSSSLVKDILAKEMPADIFDSAYGRDTLAMEEKFDVEKCKELIKNGWLSDSKKEEVRGYLGEAYFMRALSYFYLVRFWGDVPCFANNQNTKGVDGTVAVSGQIPRTPVKAVYEKMIMRDLLVAIELLPKASRTEDSSRPNVWAAKTTLADVYLNMAGWPMKETARYKDCYDLCADIIKNSGYELVGKYDQLWKLNKTTESVEHIFALHHFKEKNQAANYGMSYYATEENVGGEGWSDYLLDAEFYKKFPEDNRLKLIAVTEFENEYVESGEKKTRMLPYAKASKKAPAIGKYRDYGGKESPQTPGLTAIYRFAEVLLMYAEAYNEYNQAPDALAIKCLKDIRNRAGYAEEVGSAVGYKEFKKMVFDEYGWEFVCEGKRWFQLVRTETVVAQNQYNVAIKTELDKRGIKSEADAQSNGGYLMPVYSKAIDDAKNVGVTITQNPGY